MIKSGAGFFLKMLLSKRCPQQAFLNLNESGHAAFIQTRRRPFSRMVGRCIGVVAVSERGHILAAR
jgi:hypothetical protein